MDGDILVGAARANTGSTLTPADHVSNFEQSYPLGNSTWHLLITAVRDKADSLFQGGHGLVSGDWGYSHLAGAQRDLAQP